MLAKKTISMLSAAAMLAAAAPVFADHGPNGFPGNRSFHRELARAATHDQGFVYQTVWNPHTERYEVREIAVPPAYHEHYGYGADRAYHGAAPDYRPVPVYQPAPVYVERRDNTAGIIGGAAIGAVVGSQVGDRHSRPATTAIGAFIGAIIGSGF